MKRFAPLAILVLSCALVGFAIWSADRGYRSETFSGSAFFASSESDCTRVYAAFESFLKTQGFRPAQSPSEFDSWTGVHSEGAKRIWYALPKGGKNRDLHLYVDLDARHVRTSIKWQIAGSRKSARLAKEEGLRFALAVDEWFKERPERQAAPKDVLEDKTQWIETRLAAIVAR